MMNGGLFEHNDTVVAYIGIRMKRYYYTIDDLDDLELIKIDLVELGVEPNQFHIYSSPEKSAELYEHDLHPISDFTMRDIVHSSLIGLGIGLLCAMIVLLSFYYLGWVQPPLGWLPAIFLAIVITGFCLWEGGLKGIQETNHELIHFKWALNQGKHVFYIDIPSSQKSTLADVVAMHPKLVFVGYGHATSSWLIHGQTHLQKFIKAMP